MSHYEFTFLVDDAEAVKKLEDILTSFSGKKVSEKPWGKRLFTYPIDKKTAAEYYTWDVEMEAANIDKFKTKLNYENVLIRYLLLKKER